MNKNIESIKEELTNFQENIKIESKKKYIEILELINNENETINKKIKQSRDEVITILFLFSPFCSLLA